MPGDEIFEAYKLNLESAIEDTEGDLEDAASLADDKPSAQERIKKLKERLETLKDLYDDLSRRPPGEPTVPRYTQGELEWVPADGTFDPSSTLEGSRVPSKERLPRRTRGLVAAGVVAVVVVVAALVMVGGGGGSEEVSANSPSSESTTTSTRPSSTTTVASSSTTTVPPTTTAAPTTAAPATTPTTAATTTTVLPSGALIASGFNYPTWTQANCQTVAFTVTNESDTEVVSAAFTFVLAQFVSGSPTYEEAVVGPETEDLALPPGGSTSVAKPVCLSPSDFPPGSYFEYELDRTCYEWTWLGGSTGAYAPGDC